MAVDVQSLLRGYEYATEVIEGDIVAGTYIVKACQRFISDLEKSQDDDYEWEFSPYEAARYVNFIEKICKHSRGSYAGKPFILSPWQVFFVMQIFGWVDKKNPKRRRFTTAHLFVARKSGKSQLAAAITLAMAVLDDDGAPQLVSAATKKDQAKEVWDEVVRTIKQSPALLKRFTPQRAEVRGPKGGTIKPLSSDANSLDGLNLNLAVVDEFHAMRTGDLYRVLASSMGSRLSPLMLAITTAGFLPDGPCANFMAQGKKVLDGQLENDRLLILTYEIDDPDKWDDIEELKKANPGLGVSISEEFLMAQATNARMYGSQSVNEFKVKHCNLFMGSADVWIGDEDWMDERNLKEPLEGSINKKTKKEEVFIGLDLASTDDITAVAMIKGNVEDGWGLKMHYFLPERAVEKRLAKDETSIYANFKDNPDVTLTPGNTTDYAAVRRYISGYYREDGQDKYDEESLAHKYHIKSLAYDRWNSLSLVQQLDDDGVAVDGFGQGFAQMSYPSKEFEKYVLEGKMQHQGDEVLRWMLGNITLQVDPAGNIKPDKAKSGDKIDGVVAAIMALGEALRFDDTEEQGFEFFMTVLNK